ncbi:MAG: NosD domain-containing protein [Desulfobacterales bacterium]|nr:NosD domain-containing protein [Desulfobacterales bacterium]
MKKYLMAILFLLAFAASGHAAVAYVDLVSGNDTTGDGTAGNPYLTAEKADDILTGGGDEIRVKKSTIVALAGTLTFTNGSDSITTSADLSGVLASGYLISKNSESGGTEGWWHVSSVTTNTITLSAQYWGTSQTTSAYYVIPAATDDSHWDGVKAGASKTSRMKISGGWDLSTETRNGYTAVTNSDPNGTIRISSDYIELGYFIAVSLYSSNSTYGAFYVTGSYGYSHDLYASGANLSIGFNLTGRQNIVSDVVCTGGEQNFLIAGGDNNYVEDLYCYTSCSTPSSYGNLAFIYSSNNIIKNASIFNSPIYGVVSANSGYVYISNATISNNVSAGVYTQNTGPIYLSDSTISYSTIGISLDASSIAYIYDITYSNNSGVDVGIVDISSCPAAVPGAYELTSAGVHKTHFRDAENGTRIYQSNTTEARSGTCINIPAAGGYVYTPVKIGSVKITSAASDITLSVYMRADASYSGFVAMYAIHNGKPVVPYTDKTLTTSYTQQSITVSSADLVVGEYLDLWVGVSGTAGNVYIDDFSYAQ